MEREQFCFFFVSPLALPGMFLRHLMLHKFCIPFNYLSFSNLLLPVHCAVRTYAHNNAENLNGLSCFKFAIIVFQLFVMRTLNLEIFHIGNPHDLYVPTTSPLVTVDTCHEVHLNEIVTFTLILLPLPKFIMIVSASILLFSSSLLAVFVEISQVGSLPRSTESQTNVLYIVN